MAMKSILKTLAVNAALLFIGILILELTLGEWFNSGHLNRLNIQKKRVYRYDVSALYADPEPIITYSRDQHGLRGSHSTPDNIDLLTVGGSTTEQRLIRDGATWQDALQQQFEQTGVSIVVSNAGVDGQSTYGHIKNFEWWFNDIPGLAPDYMLFYVGINDFHKEAGDEYDDLLGEFNLGQSIKDNSAIWYLVRTIRGAYFARVKKLVHQPVDFNELQWTQQALRQDYRFMQPRLDAYANRLRILADLSSDFGATPIFVSQPTRHYRITPDSIEGHRRTGSYDDYKYNGVDYYHMIRQLDAVTQAVAIDKKAIYVDLGGHTDWEDSDFYDYSHMTPQGTKKVGLLLHEALKSTITTGRQVPSPGSQRSTLKTATDSSHHPVGPRSESAGYGTPKPAH
jgi:lysophospholipase L1-like esterase